MKGCLAVIGGIAVLFFVVMACSVGNVATHFGQAQHEFGNNAGTSNSSSDGGSNNSKCQSAIDHANQAWDDYNAGDYSGGYKNADSGARLAESCDDKDMPAAKGAALFAKAVNEHHLSQGDSVTDLNQAITLLSECQTQPGYYGTHLGAQCETAEEHAISWKTNWELNQ